MMWTLPTLTSITFFTLLGSAWIVRVVSPFLWNINIGTTDILVSVTTIPEIESAQYYVFVVAFILLFLFLALLLRSIISYEWFPRFISAVAYTFVLYLLIAPYSTLFSVDSINPWVLVGSAIAGGFLSGLKQQSDSVLGMGFIGLFFRYALKPVAKFDVGSMQFTGWEEYVYYAFSRLLFGFAILVPFVLHRYSAFFRAVSARFSKKTVSFILIGSITLSLLFLMRRSRDVIDIYFTLLPAYQVARGGVLLVTAMSQYGLLYLMPWVAVLTIFPDMPVTFLSGVVITLGLLIVYFAGHVYVAGNLIRGRAVFILTVIASYFFTILVRFYGFTDEISLVSAPAFTPLRFGMFIIPLWALIRYVRRGEQRWLRAFLVISSLMFFYSFEMGAGILVSGIMIAFLDVVLQRTGNVRRGIEYGGIIALTLVLFWGGYCLYAYALTGQVPSIETYALFSTLYSSGYLLLPIEGQVGFFLPLTVALIGLIVGVFACTREDKDGYLFIYLSLIVLVEFPYFMGRSVFPTLYGISLPFILLSGLWVSKARDAITDGNQSSLHLAALLLCGSVLAIGTARGAAVMGDMVLHSAIIVEHASGYISYALKNWDIRSKDNYVFLRNNLPNGCPLVSFDPDEMGLIPALGTVPAFQYGFLRGFVVRRQQVDSLTPATKKNIVCVFVNDGFIRANDHLVTGVYRYFWNTYQQSAVLIAFDEQRGFLLYSVPASAFVAKHAKR